VIDDSDTHSGSTYRQSSANSDGSRLGGSTTSDDSEEKQGGSGEERMDKMREDDPDTGVDDEK
jgi:hypothetical protein